MDRRRRSGTFWDYLTPGANGCLEFSGARSNGYGRIWWNGRLRQASRIAWELVAGQPIPDDLFVCHACDNPACCRPDHLFLGNNSENIKDAIRKGRHVPPAPNRGKLICKRGHPFTGNTFIRPNGWRICLICRKETRHGKPKREAAAFGA